MMIAHTFEYASELIAFCNNAKITLDKVIIIPDVNTLYNDNREPYIQTAYTLIYEFGDNK